MQTNPHPPQFWQNFNEMSCLFLESFPFCSKLKTRQGCKSHWNDLQRWEEGHQKCNKWHENSLFHAFFLFTIFYGFREIIYQTNQTKLTPKYTSINNISFKHRFDFILSKSKVLLNDTVLQHPYRWCIKLRPRLHSLYWSQHASYSYTIPSLHQDTIETSCARRRYSS